jgi:hypothetical protein
VFATKLSPDGSSLIYSALFGGSNTNGESTIAVDASGNAYVGGNSQSPDFPTTPGAFQPTAAGDWHPFLSKINPAGTGFVFSTRIGGTDSTDFSHSVAVDSAGNAFLVGEAHSSNFPTTPGVIKRTKAAGSVAGFVARFTNHGALAYSTLFGDGSVFSIALDSADDAFVTGGASNIPVTAGAFRKTSKAGDAFVAKINPSGTKTLYGTFLGGSGGDLGAGIAVNSAGQAFVFGETFSTDFPLTADAFEEIPLGNHCGDTSSSPCPAGFITKLNATGTGLLYSSYFGALAGVFVNDGSDGPGQIIGLDSKGSVYVTGFTGSPNFPTTNTAFKQKLLPGATDRQDGFVSKITPLCALKSTIPSVTVCSPAAGATVRSPVTIIAGTHSSRHVRVLQVYVDGKKQYQANLSAVEVKLPMTAGKHRFTVQAIDTANATFKTAVSITVAR